MRRAKVEPTAKFADRIKGLLWLPPSRVEPSPSNFRTHGTRQQAAMRGVLSEIGVAGAVIAWVPDDRARALLARGPFGTWSASFKGQVRLIDGHLRREQLRQDIPVLITDLDEREAAKALATFDAVGDLAGVDSGLLSRLLDDVGPIPNFDDGMGDLLHFLREQVVVDIPKVGDDDMEEPLDEPTVSCPGEVYALGRHRLACGDSRDRAVVDRVLGGSLPKLWLYDPPFDRPYSDWSLLPTVDVVAVWHRSDSAYRWMAETFGDGWGSHSLVFTGGVRGQHNYTLPCCMHENVTVWRRKWWRDKSEAIDSKVIRASGCKATSDGRPISWQEHSGGVASTTSVGMSWAKPVMQSEILVSYVPRGSVIADFCAGSGSSLIATEKHGRIWRGVELEPKWADLIRKRWGRWSRDNNRDPGTGAL